MATKNDDFTYKVYNPQGKLICQTNTRYDRDTELAMLESGHTIKLNGRKLTKKEIKDGKK